LWHDAARAGNAAAGRAAVAAGRAGKGANCAEAADESAMAAATVASNIRIPGWGQSIDYHRGSKESSISGITHENLKGNCSRRALHSNAARPLACPAAPR
jgi:hypothetical protein